MACLDDQLDTPPTSYEEVMQDCEAMLLTDLPFDVLEFISKYLTAGDLLRSSSVCKKLYMTSTTHCVWKWRSHQDYGVKFADNNSCLDCITNEDHYGQICWSRCFYLKILQRFGSALRCLWKRYNMKEYGNLATVLYHDKQLRLVQWETPVSVTGKLLSQELCRIYLDDTFTMVFGIGSALQSGYVKGVCLNVNINGEKGGENKDKDHDHEDEFEFVNEDDRNENNECFLEIQFEDCVCTFLQQSVQDSETLNRFRCEKLKSIKRFWTHLPNHVFKSISSHSSWLPDVCPIKPGLYKGDYDFQDIELLFLSYTEDKLIGRKVTGDNNIPHGEISINVDLNRIMVLNEFQQKSMDDLSALYEKAEYETRKPSAGVCYEHPFVLPDCIEGSDTVELFKDLTICKYRFSAAMQVAYPNFGNPHYMSANFVAFNEDLFAMIIFDLSDVCLFHRVTDDLFHVSE